MTKPLPILFAELAKTKCTDEQTTQTFSNDENLQVDSARLRHLASNSILLTNEEEKEIGTQIINEQKCYLNLALQNVRTTRQLERWYRHIANGSLSPFSVYAQGNDRNNYMDEYTAKTKIPNARKMGRKPNYNKIKRKCAEIALRCHTMALLQQKDANKQCVSQQKRIQSLLVHDMMTLTLKDTYREKLLKLFPDTLQKKAQQSRNTLRKLHLKLRDANWKFTNYLAVLHGKRARTDELVLACYEGLWEGILRWNPLNGKFVTCTSQWIANRARQYNKEEDTRPQSSNMNKLAATALRLNEIHNTQYGLDLPFDKLAQKVEATPERLQLALNGYQQMLCLDYQSNSKNCHNKQIANQITAKQTPQERLDKKERTQIIQKLLQMDGVLTPRQQDVMNLLYGERELNQVEASKILGISNERVRQLESEAIKNLRLYVGKDKDGIFIRLPSATNSKPRCFREKHFFPY